MRKAFWGIIAAFLLFLLTPAFGQSQPAMPQDETIDSKIQAEIIDSITRALNEVYVFPDMAKKMEKHVQGLYKKGEYKEFTSLSEFAEKLTMDLRDICHDRHLGIRYTPDITEDDIRTENDTITDEDRQRHFKRLASVNFGFKEMKILPGG